MKERVIKLKGKYSNRLGTVRHAPGWKAATDENEIWLKGPVNNGAFQTVLLSLPAEASYLLNGEGLLFPVGKQVPVMLLKELPWQNLRNFVPLEMPVSAMPGETNRKVEIKLVRSSMERQAYALRTNLVDWKAYVETAPLLRLQQLRFAVSEEKSVLIIGTPLPALRGQLYWRRKNLLVPAGFDFEMPVVADLLPVPDGFAVFDEAGTREMVPPAAFAAAGRAIVRLLDEM